VAVAASAAQTPAPVFGECKTNTAAPAAGGAAAEAGQTSGLRIEAKGADGKPLQRERFYLLTRSVQSAGGLDWSGAPLRADFLKGASPELRAALEKHDCDTLYCPELVGQYEKLVKEVPEFREAFAAGMRKYNNRRLALDWLTVNFPRKEASTGYYESKRRWLGAAAAKAGAVTSTEASRGGAPAYRSVMTNEEGVAIFIGVPLGKYYVSNLLPAGAARLLWDCEVTIPPPGKKELHSASVVMSAPKPEAGAAGSK
jgi:hypothetical protein